jgi:hypothetical protein
MNGEGASGRRGQEIRRKKLDIEQTKLDHAASVLGARSDVIDQALDLVLFREELIDGIRSLAGTGGVENYFDEHPDW